MLNTKVLTLGIVLQYNIQNIHEPNNFEYFLQKIFLKRCRSNAVLGTNSNIVVYNFKTPKYTISLRFKS